MPCSVVVTGWNIPEQQCSGQQLCLLLQTDHAPWAWSLPDGACSHTSPAPYMQLLYSQLHCCTANFIAAHIVCTMSCFGSVLHCSCLYIQTRQNMTTSQQQALA